MKQGTPDSTAGCACWNYWESDSNIMLFVTIGLVKSCYFYN